MDFPADYLTTMSKSLLKLHSECSEFITKYDSEPEHISQASNEIQTAANPTAIIDSWTIGLKLIEYSGEHVTAFVKTITEPMEPFACFTCVRSMLEASAVSAWLFDPSIDVNTRYGRTLSLRYAGQKQRRVFENSAGASPASIDATDVQIKAIKNEMLVGGFVNQKQGKTIVQVSVQEMLGPTEMIRSVLGEETNYRMLSAIAHGHHWALDSLGYVPAGSYNIKGVDVNLRRKEANRVAIALVGSAGIKAFCKPIWSLCHYFGWDNVELKGKFEDAANSLGIAANRRFWIAP